MTLTSRVPPPSSVSVVLVTFNSAAVLHGFLESLPAAMSGVEEWELVVVDNASSDSTVSVVRHHAPDATLVETGKNAGYAAGVNAGVAASRRLDAVLVCNPDVRPSPGSVRRLINVLADPGTGIVVPRLCDGNGALLYSLRREPSVTRMVTEALLGGRRAGTLGSLGEVVYHRAAYERENTSDWASGAIMLMSRRCLDLVGLWDESFFLYSEETDFSLRARDAGLLLRYTPEATAVHLGGESKVSVTLYTILTVNRSRLYAARHGRGVSWFAFHLCLLAREAIRSPISPTHRAAVRALVRWRCQPSSVRRRL